MTNITHDVSATKGRDAKHDDEFRYQVVAKFRTYDMYGREHITIVRKNTRDRNRAEDWFLTYLRTSAYLVRFDAKQIKAVRSHRKV